MDADYTNNISARTLRQCTILSVFWISGHFGWVVPIDYAKFGRDRKKAGRF
jgi:hypothetical protein